MVSPEYKGGYGATSIEAVSPDGDSVAYYSPGAFAGAPAGLSALNFDSIAYLARRSPSSWSTTPLMPPDTLAPTVFGRPELSPSLSSEVALAKPGPSNEASEQEGTRDELLLYDTALPDMAESWRRIGDVFEAGGKPLDMSVIGASNDLCHVLFYAKPAILAAGEGAYRPLYEQTRGCSGEASETRVVSLDNKGRVISGECPAWLGIEKNSGEVSAFNAVADGGQEVFFTTCVENQTRDYQLFVRLGGERTVEVSRPLAEDCGEGGARIPCREAAKRSLAAFAGASEDGSRVYFMSSAPLTGETADASNNLYLATIGCPAGEPECPVGARTVTSLVRASHAPRAGVEAGVQGGVRVAPDGSRAYFVASGDLLGEAEQAALQGEGRPVPHTGADNMYVYTATTGEVAFVAELCSGYDASGAAEDPYCPSGESDSPLWSYINVSPAQTAGADGRFLVFPSEARLTRDDTDTAADIYRFDAATGTLERVSVGESGRDANGNNSQFAAKLLESGAIAGSVRSVHNMVDRAVSEDGSRIVFLTSDPLSPLATNGLMNAYEWHDGQVALVSGGGSEQAVEDATISASGDDVFFVTSQGLVPRDTDGAQDVYDAHLCTASAPCAVPPETERRPCEGDGCQGPLTNPAPLLVPGSVPQATGENRPPLKNATSNKLSAAQQLARALKACAKKPKRKRAACRRSARKKHTKAAKPAGRRTRR